MILENLTIWAIVLAVSNAYAFQEPPLRKEDPDEWVQIATSDEGSNFSVRQRDIATDQYRDNRIVWVLMKSVPDSMATRVLFRYNFDCVGKTLFTDYRTFFDQQGGIDAGYETPWLKRKPFIPGTISELLADKICEQR